MIVSMTPRLIFVLLILVLAVGGASAQSSGKLSTDPASPAAVAPRERLLPPSTNPARATEENNSKSDAGANKEKEKSAGTETPAAAPDQFRVEVMPLVGGAELLTIFGRLDGLKTNRSAPEVPLLSVVRDTLADADPENDRLRYVWMLTYTRPNLTKRIASAIPFLYQHVGNQSQAADRAPKPILDLTNPSRQTWNRFFWQGMQNIFLDTYGIPLKASSRTYRQNASDYRAGHVMQALSILDSFERLRQRSRDEGELLALSASDPQSSEVVSDSTTPLIPKNAFRVGEMLEMRARLILTAKTFGGLLGPDVFPSTVIKRTMASVDNSGHNWELLRQRAEAEGLYFEPLTMPDGFATHAILWVAKSDLQSGAPHDFHPRFLNVSNPWADDRLRNWTGYSRTSWFDSENRRVNPNDPGARPVEMIPLAVYGLDHPKIPALLIDFRDSLNPKKREMSRRLFSDLAKNIFSLSTFGDLPYFAGKRVYDFVTGQRGMDLNQPTRLRSYSELKLLLSFNSTIDAKLRAEIEHRVQNVSLNPLNNDNASELQLARQQYEALIDYARRPDGLSARIERDRRAEMVPLEHGKTARFFYNLGNVLSFGRYVHRETATPELSERLELARRVEYHTQLLQQIGKSSPQTEVAWDGATVKHSLRFLAEQGSDGKGSAAKAVARIFVKTSDAETRQLCLEALPQINNKPARAELLRIYQEQQLQPDMRADIAVRLRQAVATDARIKPAEAKSLLSQVGTP
jgi:hypothetical protein